MHQGMGGAHRFQIDVPSNDPVEPAVALTIAARYPTP
jgi:hypothetical protein